MKKLNTCYPHKSSEQPVPNGTKVEAKSRNPELGTLTAFAEFVDWEKHNAPSDIIEYRILSLPEKKKWIENTGVKPDLPDDTMIKAKLRDGTKGTITIGGAEWWTLDGDISDIIKYKVIKAKDHTRPLQDPKPGIHSITDAVKADLDQRRKDGIAKYGGELKSHNGRDSLVDLYQELLDASLYLKQFLVESDK